MEKLAVLIFVCVNVSLGRDLQPMLTRFMAPDHSSGMTCPGDETKTCLPGYRCNGGNCDPDCILSLDKIAFEAYTTDTKGHFENGKVLIFPEVSLNDGQGYDPKTGVFKAPVAGVYYFTVHVCSTPRKHMVVAIVKGNKQIAVTTVYESPHSSCTSHSAIARVEENESVQVVARWSESYLESDAYRWPSFSGYLVYNYY